LLRGKLSERKVRTVLPILVFYCSVHEFTSTSGMFRFNVFIRLFELDLKTTIADADRREFKI